MGKLRPKEEPRLAGSCADGEVELILPTPYALQKAACFGAKLRPEKETQGLACHRESRSRNGSTNEGNSLFPGNPPRTERRLTVEGPVSVVLGEPPLGLTS